ncbi:enkurin domain-containing protein 1-like [Paramacrobiotus metropolitanus]|uniref:enkurin domain-containing protein 1-like n=1 Tax=Paramacrobiotus metropolitanus TaxID=2943436 RepID=UPI0024462872|nr:enkurin domain-containing protein 1-like [Paramacrobiotus metropolitanus]XP_055331970.1 enkurin domain-containing protein 1-like [Paramacrobiotus metropolitanus]XP_055331971.1 enkurin domain-containing protein 1-like [Paramacrobiotus metropolitanus]
MKSLLHDEVESRALPPKVKNRTRNEGMLYQKRGSEGTMRHILSDPAIVPPRPKPTKKREEKNFTQENIRRIRQIAVQRELVQQNYNKSLAATWSISRPAANSIPASGQRPTGANRPLSGLPRPQNTAPPRPARPLAPLNSTVIRSRSQTSLPTSDPSLRQRNASYNRLNRTGGVTVSPLRPTSSVQALNRTSKNFVQVNTQNLLPRSRSAADLRGRPTGPRSVPVKPEMPRNKPGALPQYLLDRRQEWKKSEEEAKIAAQQPKLPPGCYIMPEDERLALIQQLQQSREKKEREIFLLPVRSDTLRAQRKRQELEAAVAEIEEGLEILSKPTVVVQDPNAPTRSPSVTFAPPPRPVSAKVANGRPVPKGKPVWNRGAVDHNKGLVNPKLLTKKASSGSLENVKKPPSPLRVPIINSHTKIFKKTM